MSEYPEVNMSDDEFIVLLKDKIMKKEPFCFTRFGDAFVGSYRVLREKN
ncbi:MAG: hypothetical protein GTO02_01585 [Candidatus Dadabacteria bacterium]|nr:hypothetical protein [Candidatus Dadabacteria bacterium]